MIYSHPLSNDSTKFFQLLRSSRTNEAEGALKGTVGHFARVLHRKLSDFPVTVRLHSDLCDYMVECIRTGTPKTEETRYFGNYCQKVTSNPDGTITIESNTDSRYSSSITLTEDEIDIIKKHFPLLRFIQKGQLREPQKEYKRYCDEIMDWIQALTFQRMSTDHELGVCNCPGQEQRGGWPCDKSQGISVEDRLKQTNKDILRGKIALNVKVVRDALKVDLEFKDVDILAMKLLDDIDEGDEYYMLVSGLLDYEEL